MGDDGRQCSCGWIVVVIVVMGVVSASRSENGGLGGVISGGKGTRCGDGETIADVESNEC